MSSDTVSTMSPTHKPLTALDRCDRCGAQARIVAMMPAGSELLFCVHHFNEFGPGLEKSGAQIYDDRDVPTPATT